MADYQSIKEEVIVEEKIEKSRFIAYMKPVTDEDGVRAYWQRVKEQHPQATHHVPGAVVGNQGSWQWTSDDGEPHGTAGHPVLNVLKGNRLTNVVIVVVRYFGGVKLGTGGLVRAYGGMAKKAVETAQRVEVDQGSLLEIQVDYAHLNGLKQMVEIREAELETLEYSDKVHLEIRVPQGEVQAFKEAVADITFGTGKIIREVKKNA